MGIGTVFSYEIINEGGMKENIVDYFNLGGTGIIVFSVWVLAFTTISGAIILMNTQLILFHCYLRARGLKTYDYLLIRRRARAVRENRVAP